jgi:hypothetical protein
VRGACCEKVVRLKSYGLFPIVALTKPQYLISGRELNSAAVPDGKLTGESF